MSSPNGFPGTLHTLCAAWKAALKILHPSLAYTVFGGARKQRRGHRWLTIWIECRRVEEAQKKEKKKKKKKKNNENHKLESVSYHQSSRQTLLDRSLSSLIWDISWLLHCGCLCFLRLRVFHFVFSLLCLINRMIQWSDAVASVKLAVSQPKGEPGSRWILDLAGKSTLVA